MKSSNESLIKVAVRAHTLCEIARYWADLKPQQNNLVKALDNLSDDFKDEIKLRGSRFPWQIRNATSEHDLLMNVAIHAYRLKHNNWEDETNLRKALEKLPEHIIKQINWLDRYDDL